MNAIKTLKNDLGRVICEMSYDEKENWIYTHWDGFANLENIKSWGENYLYLLEKTKCPYFLNDDRDSKGPWFNALEWIQNYLIPNAISKGVRYYAHVVSKSAFAYISSQELLRRIDNILEVHSFDNLTEAQAWLKQKQKSDNGN